MPQDFAGPIQPGLNKIILPFTFWSANMGPPTYVLEWRRARVIGIHFETTFFRYHGISKVAAI